MTKTAVCYFCRFLKEAAGIDGSNETDKNIFLRKGIGGVDAPRNSSLVRGEVSELLGRLIRFLGGVNWRSEDDVAWRSLE